MQEALAAVKAQAQTPVTTLLAGDQAKVIKERAISVFGNVDQVGPLLITMMQKQQETMSGLVGVPEIIGAVYKAYLPVYQQMVSQTKGVVIAGGWNDTGLLIDEVIAFKDGSELAKAMASLPQGGPWLNRLPDINYVLAAGGAGSADNPGPVVSLATDMIDPRSQGQVLGVINSLNSLSSVVAPVIGAPLLAMVSHFPAGDWRIGTPMYFCAFLQAAAMFFFYYRQRIWR